MNAAITVVRATPDQFPVVLQMVERLLLELAPGTTLPSGAAAGLHAAGSRFVAFLALDHTDEPIGVITLTDAVAIYAGGRYGIISELYVVPGRRSAGVGHQLLAAVRAEAGRQGWQRIDVTAPPDGRWGRTVAFYEQNGFVLTGRKLKLLL